jgi:F0F1-type ATP synthase assembly protein I
MILLNDPWREREREERRNQTLSCVAWWMAGIAGGMVGAMVGYILVRLI